MKKRLSLLAAVAALAVGVSTTAYAFDCIRVSSSAKGLIQSTKSGNWLPFLFGTGAQVQKTFNDVFEIPISIEDANCVAAEYATTGLPRYFALGIGVAGGKKASFPENSPRGEGFGVLAWNNKVTDVLSDNHGIDHFEKSPIIGGLIGALVECGVEVPE